jgi:hypothetical protein
LFAREDYIKSASERLFRYPTLLAKLAATREQDVKRNMGEKAGLRQRVNRTCTAGERKRGRSGSGRCSTPA